MTRFFKIADIVFSIESDGVEVQKELDDFEVDNNNTASIEMIISRDKFEYSAKTVASYPDYSIMEEEENYILSFTHPDMVYGYRLSKNEKKAVIYVDKYLSDCRDTRNVEIREDEEGSITAGEFLMYAVRDAFLFYAQKEGYIALHSASLVYKNKIYAFSAKSGGGKSTQMENWIRQGIECERFNGDILLIKPFENKVMAYGMPWCGTSKIYCNKNLEFAGVFFIFKNENNYVEEIGKVDEVISLNARCITPNWKKELLALNVETCKKIIERIRTYNFYCTKEPQSALILQKFIDEKEKNI